MSEHEQIEPQETVAADVAQEVPQDVAQDAPETPAPAWDPEIEDDARLFGWKPPSEWQGEKPEGYIDNPK